MALRGKYAALPDIDSAPDIYETPELTDDNSTVPGTTLRSGSDDGYDEDLGDDETGISRSKLRVDDARSRFDSKKYNASGIDFSDRVDGKRRSYKASSRRRLDDGTEEIGDLTDDEDAESLERKIARLKREVEEAKGEYERRRAASTEPKSEEVSEDSLVSLGQALEQISLPLGHTRAAASTQMAKPTAQSSLAPGEVLDEPTYTVTYAPSYEQTHTLVKTAEFDNRLLLLEKAIGASAAGLDVDLNGLPRAIVPTLDTLQKQISTLSQASTATLDSISRRVRTLTQEAEQLTRARKDAKEAKEALESGGERSEGGDGDEQDAKINALYGTLATIEGLAPLLPPLLDRLRSLRAIHADAATASETLDRIEKQQTDTATELKQWREGLIKIEEAMKQGDSVMSGNMKVMESWVKDLEERMAKLS